MAYLLGRLILADQLDGVLRDVYNADYCRHMFAQRGIPNPAADAIERCKTVAKDAAMRLPAGSGNVAIIEALDDAFSEQIDREVKELKTLAR